MQSAQTVSQSIFAPVLIQINNKVHDVNKLEQYDNDLINRHFGQSCDTVNLNRSGTIKCLKTTFDAGTLRTIHIGCFIYNMHFAPHKPH